LSRRSDPHDSLEQNRVPDPVPDLGRVAAFWCSGLPTAEMLTLQTNTLHVTAFSCIVLGRILSPALKSERPKQPAMSANHCANHRWRIRADLGGAGQQEHSGNLQITV
jgi:hypothetical protein